MSGGDLNGLIGRFDIGGVPGRMVKTIGAHATAGLLHMHSVQMLHLDLEPANIFMHQIGPDRPASTLSGT